MTKRSPVVLVTGASSGIGHAVASAFAAKGFEVFGTSRNPRNTEPIAGVELIQLDVTDDESVAAAVSTVVQRAGRVDILVNNAGFGVLGAAEESSTAQAQQLFDTNFFGLVRVTREVLPYLRAQRSGRIINIASISGRGYPGASNAAYAASKGAVISLTWMAAQQLGRHNINVNAICPGVTRTELGARNAVERAAERGITVAELNAEAEARIPIGRANQPEDIAAMAVFLRVVLTAFPGVTHEWRQIVTFVAIQVSGPIRTGPLRMP